MFIISKHSALSSTRQDVFLILTASAAVPPRTQSAAQLPSLAPHDSKARLQDVTKRRDSWRSHVHRTRLRSACSSSSCKPAMSGVEGPSHRPFSRGFKGDTLFREREYPPLAHSRTVREQRAALPRCQFRFPYGKTISPEAKSCRGRREHENADAARSVPPARRCWTRRGNSQCPSPW